MRHVWLGGPTSESLNSSDLWFLNTDAAYSLVRDGAGVWTQLQGVDSERIPSYSFTLIGGHRQPVPAYVYAELVALGYSAFFENFAGYSDTYVDSLED